MGGKREQRERSGSLGMTTRTGAGCNGATFFGFYSRVTVDSGRKKQILRCAQDDDAAATVARLKTDRYS
jgi:hypothetical protein